MARGAGSALGETEIVTIGAAATRGEGGTTSFGAHVVALGGEARARVSEPRGCPTPGACSAVSAHDTCGATITALTAHIARLRAGLTALRDTAQSLSDADSQWRRGQGLPGFLARAWTDLNTVAVATDALLATPDPAPPPDERTRAGSTSGDAP